MDTSSEDEEEEVGEAPRFTTPLKPQHATIGKEVRLECVVTANPAPEVQWFKGDKEVGKPTTLSKEKATYNPKTGVATLDISEVSEEDLTIFKVRAVNKFGRAECRANIVETYAPVVEKTEILMAPKITKPLEAMLVRARETVVLEAKFEGKPMPSIKWYRNGKEIHPGRSQMEVVVEEGVTKLEIPEIFKEDGGKYEVRAMNEVGEARCSGTVAVTEPQTEEMAEVKPPRFIKQLQPQMVPEGDVVIMEAQVDSHPTSSFQWFLHSVPVQSSHDMRITTEGNKSIMVIDEALSEHAGNVTVRAENVAGSVTSMATLAILPEHITETVEEFAAPLFPSPLKATLRVMDGEEVHLTCKVTGKPIPKVLWFHNGKPVKEGKEVTIYQDTEGICKLAIAEVFPEDAGQYTCRAVNRIGETVCATSLVVEAYEYVPDSEIASVTVGTSLTTGHSGSEEDLLAEKETLSEVSEEDADLPDSEIGTAPLFTTKLPSVFYATEKEMARLETKVTGEPRPKVHWYKKGKKIKPTKAMQIENMEDGTSVLTISEVTPEDAGPILCEGQNRLGMDTTTTELIVEEHLESKSYKKPEWVSKMEEMKKKLQATKSTPTFIREVRDERAKELETVTFECQYSGNPTPDVVWYHDNQVVRNTKNIKIRIKDKKTTLTIYEVTQEHEGAYICKATNELGTVASKGNLYVTGLTEEERKKIEKKKAPKEKPRKVEKEVEEIGKIEEVVRKTQMEKKKSVTQEFSEQITQEVTQQVSQHVSEEIIHKELPKEKEIEEMEEIETVIKKTHKEKQKRVEAIHRATPIDVPSEETGEVPTSKPEMVRPTLSQDLVENAYVEEVMQWVAAKEFGPGESPLRDLARIGFLTRHGTSVSEVTTMYETGEFPALRTPEAQIAMVQVVERIGHGAVISEVLSEETTMETSVEETGFRAFMRMAEQHQVNVEEAIFSFQPEDFRIQAWETTEGELHTAETSEVHVKEMKTKQKKRVTVKTEMEEQEDAALHITQEAIVYEDEEKETIVTEIREGDMLFAICSYVAENEEALNLVEGERMYVLECHNSDWWFVKKHLTEEKGWVPAQFLKDEASYTLYVQRKLNEKIDKLPVLEKPATEEPVFAPRFIEKVQPKHVPDGSTVQFECKVEGNPRPLITWFRQTAIIKPSPDFQMFYDEDNVATLVVREVFPEDAGMFTCVAKNAAGFASSTAELIVEAPLSDHGSDIVGPPSRKSLSRESSLADILEGIPPTFSQKPKAHVVDEKSDVTLECRLVAVPEPTVKWLFEGKEIIEKESKISISTVSDMHMYTSTLKIYKVKKSQEGTYEIKATNREGEATVSIVLKVRTGAKEPPNILEPLHGTIVEEGGSVVLSTTIVGNPSPRITWMKDGKKIIPKEGDNNLKICKDEKSGINTLTIHNAQKTDAGEYSVKAENTAGKATTLASLAVEVRGVGMETLTPGIERELIAVEPRDITPSTADYIADDVPHPKPEPPLFVERFQEKTVPEKSTVRLEAKVTGYPQPEITWYKNNKRLKPAPNIRDTFDGENICLEIIDADAESDTADYKCVASNSVGKASHGARLTVDVTSVAFTKTLKNVEVEEKSTTILECETSRTVFTSWYHNDVEITRVDRKEIVDEGRKHRLIIRNVTHGDAGKYTCKVKNKKTDCSVTVTDAGPDFVRRLHDFEIKEREMAVLEVVLSAPDAEVTWHKDGEELVEDESHIVFEKEGPIRKLLIRSTSVHDEGEYTCVLGEQECTAEVTIVELPPEIITKMQDVTIAKGERATFEIELTKGDALVRWFKDGKELQFSEHVQLAIDGKRQRLMIYDSVIEDGGLYSCRVGDQESSATLKVEEPIIDFIRRLPDVTLVPQNTEAVFTVELSKEDVEVKWLRNGKTIKKSEKYNMVSEGSVRKLLIKKCTLDDQAEYTCVAVNVRSSSKLKVEILESDPRIHLDSLKKEYKIKKGEDVTFTVNYSAIPQPKDEWFVNGKLLKKTKRISQTLSDTSASLTITKVEDTDSGSYTVKLVNNCGEASAELTLIILQPPSQPGVPEMIETIEDSLTLHWKAPESDGNSPITNYILEYHDKEEFTWSKVNEEFSIVDTAHRVTGLDVRKEYMFRVTAVNEVGNSPPSHNTKYIPLGTPVAIEPPSIQEPLKGIVIGLNQSVTLSCVIGGVPTPEIKWLKDGQKLKTKTMTYENRVAKYIISKTSESSTATYTCQARNTAGFAETSCQLVVQEPPRVEVEESLISQKLRVKEQWKVEVKFTGYPKPEVSWSKDGKTIDSNKHCVIYADEMSTTIAIYSLERNDTGVYTLNASNSAGSASIDLSLRVIDDTARRSKSPSTPDVIDKPTKPEGPLVIKKIQSESVTIAWKPPVDDGGIDIYKYSLEKCDIEKKVWMKVADVEGDITSYTVQRLKEGSEYMFRVFAENPVGISEPLESDPVTVKCQFDKPSPPRGPFEVSGMTETSLTLKWQPPEWDGGTQILDYLVERREVNKKAWQKVGSTEGGTVTSIQVTNLKHNTAYHFRVTARNEVGPSTPYSQDDSITVGKRITPPSAPTSLSVMDITSRSATIQWGPPLSTGGAELTGYIIEKRISTSKKWEKVVTLEPSVTSHCVQNLKEKSEYFFRVYAENSIGLSEPAESDRVCLKTHASPPSPPTAPLEMRSIGPHTIIIEWGRPESDGGAPLEGYTIAIRDIKKTMWMEVGRVKADVQKLTIKDLQEGNEYLLRIFARNEVGLSDPLESDEPHKVLCPAEMDASELAKEELRREGEKDTPSLSFSTETTTSWMREAGMDADIRSYARSSLLRRDEYFFRIWYYARQLFK